MDYVTLDKEIALEIDNLLAAFIAETTHQTRQAVGIQRTALLNLLQHTNVARRELYRAIHDTLDDPLTTPEGER